ncbi:MAG: hypothetical protein HRU13_13580, partial [Phycisphaerales bacterium]|nr:hypothetical protein [Phycisphaerales bacterium]
MFATMRWGVLITLAIAGTSLGQVTKVAFTTDDTDTEGDRPVDGNIGVDNVDSVLVVSNMRMSIFDKAGVLQDEA